jgi:hypothetical protein
MPSNQRLPGVAGIRDADETEHAVGHVLHGRWQRLGVRRSSEYASQGDGGSRGQPSRTPSSARTTSAACTTSRTPAGTPLRHDSGRLLAGPEHG